MLLSGNIINIKTKALYVDGIIFAKTICLNGLMLNADQQINNKVQKFLKSFGAILGIYNYNIKGLKSKFVYLCGEFFITSQEIKNFLENDLKLFKDTINFPENNNQILQKYLLQKYDEYKYYYQLNISKLYPNMEIIQDNFNLYAKTKVSFKTMTILIDNDITVNACNITLSSKREKKQNSSGINSNIISKRNVIFEFKNKLYIKNSILGAVGSIDIISSIGFLELKFSSNILWFELKNKFIFDLIKLIANNKKRDSSKLVFQGVN